MLVSEKLYNNASQNFLSSQQNSSCALYKIEMILYFSFKSFVFKCKSIIFNRKKLMTDVNFHVIFFLLYFHVIWSKRISMIYECSNEAIHTSTAYKVA